ncbi:glycosyl hydrolase [Puteibacter caeruleilacunae]|nr:glycosyl hydrolase [Puteibacter caeruleilacunae]
MKVFGILMLFLVVAYGCVEDKTEATHRINEKWKIYIQPSSDPLVKWAANELAKDVGTILGTDIYVVEGGSAEESKGIFIQTIEGNESVPELSGKWEHFKIDGLPNQINIAGSDVRGTVFGIFELAERMGISPWIWWADVSPEKRNEIALTLPNNSIVEGPSVQYRGIFLNDEDWGLQPWAAKTFEPETGDIGPKTYEKIFQLLLRLKANTIWPAMHPCTKGFYTVAGNNEMAQKYHVVVGTSHCEPMLRNNVDEWDHHTNGDYNYFTNKEGVSKYWHDRVKQVEHAENIVTLGMRGIHDGHMHGGNSLEEKARMVEQIIDDQRQMLTDVKEKPIEKIATTVVLYKEVLDLYNQGLQIPEDVTIMWCDDNHGYIRRLSNEEEQKRPGGSGIYYHLSYWGSPHDYLWLSTTQPGLMWYEMNRAYQNGARKIWIANVGDIKPAEYNMELFLDMAWDIDAVKENTLDDHMKAWASREFGEDVAEDVVKIKKEYYRLASIRRPEFMGWSKVEPKTATESGTFNPLANENELQRRVELYDTLVERLSKSAERVGADQKAAWFQLMEYPVRCASLMNKKFVCAQMARQGGNVDCAAAYKKIAAAAYKEIEQLTTFYNHTMLDGKWNHMMSMAPRGLAVFKMPEIECGAEVASEQKAPFKVIPIQANESTIKEGVDGYTWRSIESLGYCDQAVTLFPLKNHLFGENQPSIQYEFEGAAGDYELQVRLLPTHVNTRDQQITVQVDDEEPKVYNYSTKGRSWQWKQNIFQNHAIVKHTGALKQKGKHTITISVNQTGIVLDQLAVSYSPGRKYYEIPLVE